MPSIIDEENAPPYTVTAKLSKKDVQPFFGVVGTAIILFNPKKTLIGSYALKIVLTNDNNHSSSYRVRVTVAGKDSIKNVSKPEI